MKLEDYERLPGFHEREALAEVEVRTAVAMGKAIDIGVIARTLEIPLTLTGGWIGGLAARLGFPKIKLTLGEARAQS